MCPFQSIQVPRDSLRSRWSFEGRNLHDDILSQRNFMRNVYNFVVSVVRADGLAQFGIRIHADIVMIKFGNCMYTEPWGLSNIRPKLIFSPNLAKSRSSITSVSVSCPMVLKSCTEYGSINTGNCARFRMIWLGNIYWANTTSRHMNLRCFLDEYSILHKALKLNGILCYSGSLHGILYLRFYVCRCQHVFCYSINVGCPGEFYYRDGSDFTGWLAGWMVGHDKWTVYEIASNFSLVRPQYTMYNTDET